jgi:hypothetical protein
MVVSFVGCQANTVGKRASERFQYEKTAPELEAHPVSKPSDWKHSPQDWK